jgi:UDP-N-acetylglucosamine 4-epimerase
MLALFTESDASINTVYNTAFGERTTLNELVNYLKIYLSDFDPLIKNVNIRYGENRIGDIPHSLASIDKAKKHLNYIPKYNIQEGLKEAISWYWGKLKTN